MLVSSISYFKSYTSLDIRERKQKKRSHTLLRSAQRSHRYESISYPEQSLGMIQESECDEYVRELRRYLYHNGQVAGN